MTLSKDNEQHGNDIALKMSRNDIKSDSVEVLPVK